MKITQLLGWKGAGAGPAAFATTGIFAAIGAGACCALPLLLAGTGLGTAWLWQIASVTAPYRSALLVVALMALAAGAILLWRQQRAAVSCPTNAVCARPAARVATLIGLLLGTALFAAAFIYG